MKIILSNDTEFEITQASVRYSESLEGKDAEDIKYPIVDFVADVDTFDIETLIENKEYFDNFTLQYGNKTRKFKGFKLYDESLRENYDDTRGQVLFFAVSK